MACCFRVWLARFFALIYINDNQKNLYEENSAKTYVWTNPATNKEVKINDNWKSEARINRQGFLCWWFVHSTDRAEEILGVETNQDMTISQYTGSYLRLFKNGYDFKKGGRLTVRHGDNARTASGHLISKKFITVQMEIVKKIVEFWRILVFRSFPKDEVWPDAVALKNKILSTVY